MDFSRKKQHVSIDRDGTMSYIGNKQWIGYWIGENSAGDARLILCDAAPVQKDRKAARSRGHCAAQEDAAKVDRHVGRETETEPYRGKRSHKAVRPLPLLWVHRRCECWASTSTARRWTTSTWTSSPTTTTTTTSKRRLRRRRSKWTTTSRWRRSGAATTTRGAWTRARS